MAAARKAAGGAGAATPAAGGCLHPSASAGADTAARRRGRQALGVAGNPLQQGAAESAFGSFASGAQRGVNQQPQHSKAFGPGSGMQQGCDARLPTGGRSSQAVPVLDAEDSADDVPPGFEADDVPPGFEQYSRAGLRGPSSSSTSGTAAPAGGVVADAPPGFEGHALRVQAVLARALQGASSAQLQQPGSAGSRQSLPGQPSLRANAFEGVPGAGRPAIEGPSTDASTRRGVLQHSWGGSRACAVLTSFSWLQSKQVWGGRVRGRVPWHTLLAAVSSLIRWRTCRQRLPQPQHRRTGCNTGAAAQGGSTQSGCTAPALPVCGWSCVQGLWCHRSRGGRLQHALL